MPQPGVVNRHAGTFNGDLLRIDPRTGAQTSLAPLEGAVDIAVVPVPEPTALSLLAACGLLALRRRRP